MKTMFLVTNTSPVGLSERVSTNIGSSEVQNFLDEAVSAIARAAKKFFSVVGSGLRQCYQYLKRKNQEGAELYLRSMRARSALDERYAVQGFSFRSYI